MALVDIIASQFEKLTTEREYRHSALGHNEIRLLELIDQNNASDSTPNIVHGRLIKASLDDDEIQYRTLSYTWGDMILDQKLIICSDPHPGSSEGSEKAVLHITKKLQLALLRFQSHPQWKYLWIDQVCINQNDLDERSVQVLLMKRIYQRAVQTIMWIGEPKDTKDLPLIAELVGALDGHELSEEVLLEGVPLMREKRPVAYDTIEDRKIQVQGAHDQEILQSKIDVRSDGTKNNTIEERRHNAVMNIFNQPYFRRAWIVQEILVSRDVRVLYGDLDIPFKILDRLGTAVLEMECETLSWFKALHNTTAGYGGFEYITLYKRNQHQDDTRSEEEFLQFLGGMQSHFESSDPRDKLYSFLGLKAEGAAPDVKPDYVRPVAEVFAECALDFINKMKSLKIFSLVEGNDVWHCRCSKRPQKFSNPEAALLVPNWCQYFHGVAGIDTPNVPVSFRSAHSLPHSTLTSNPPLSSLSLPVQGKIIGPIRRVLSQTFDRRNSYFSGLRNLLQLDEIVKELAIKEEDFRGESELDLRSTVLRTLLADGAATKTQPMKFSVKEVMALYDSRKGLDPPPSGRIDGQSDPLLLDIQMCALILQRKKFFEVYGVAGERGRAFGLGNMYVRAGDVAAVLYGSNVPIILRQAQMHHDPAQRRYKVVCQSYLDGWMWGDSPFPKWWEEFDSSPDCFVLI